MNLYVSNIVGALLSSSQPDVEIICSMLLGHVRDGASSGEQVRSSHGGGPPTSTAVVPYCSGKLFSASDL